MLIKSLYLISFVVIESIFCWNTDNQYKYNNNINNINKNYQTNKYYNNNNRNSNNNNNNYNYNYSKKNLNFVNNEPKQKSSALNRRF